jgi:hypothetical protein
MVLAARLAAAGVVLAACVVHPGAAAAKVTFDRKSLTGFVDNADVRDALGWTDATLKARAPRIKLEHVHFVHENYSVTCGKLASAWTHQLQGGVDFLTAKAEPTGFRLGRGPGISAMTVAPQPGWDCPADLKQPAGTKVTAIRLQSCTAGWALLVRFDKKFAQLLGDKWQFAPDDDGACYPPRPRAGTTRLTTTRRGP